MVVLDNENVINNLSESFEDTEKLSILEKNILKIQSDFQMNSEFYHLIHNRQCYLHKLITGLLNEMKTAFGEDSLVIQSISINPLWKIDIPETYADMLIKKELITNMKNQAATGSESSIHFNCFVKPENELELIITNQLAVKPFVNSTGEGTKCLLLLSDTPLFGFKYKFEKKKTQFLQILTFKIK